jgi:hypothetical protein
MAEKREAPTPAATVVVTLEVRPDGDCILDGQSLGRIMGASAEEAARTEEALRARLTTLTAGPELREPDGASRVRVEVRADRSAKWQSLQRVMVICSDPAIRIYKIHVKVLAPEVTPTSPDAEPR